MKYIVLAILLASCGSSYEGQYKPSPKANLGEPSSPLQSSDMASTKTPNKPIIVDESVPFDSGLDQCVATGFEKQSIKIYKPREFKDSAADLKSLKFESLSDLIDGYDRILRLVVSTEGKIDYDILRGDLNSTWTELVSALGRTNPPSNEESLSYWTNAYNIIMMDFIVKAPGVSDATLLVGSKWQVFDEPFQGGIVGRRVTLNGIEKGILKLAGDVNANDFPADWVVDQTDMRLHFALVCGAESCPKLRNFAYRNENLEQLLNENSFMFFNSENQVRQSEGRISFSELLSWYTGDFEKLAGGSLENLADQYILDTCRLDKDDIRTALQNRRLSTWEYSWKINDINL